MVCANVIAAEEPIKLLLSFKAFMFCCALKHVALQPRLQNSLSDKYFSTNHLSSIWRIYDCLPPYSSFGQKDTFLTSKSVDTQLTSLLLTRLRQEARRVPQQKLNWGRRCVRQCMLPPILFYATQTPRKWQNEAFFALIFSGKRPCFLSLGCKNQFNWHVLCLAFQP